MRRTTIYLPQIGERLETEELFTPIELCEKYRSRFDEVGLREAFVTTMNNHPWSLQRPIGETCRILFSDYGSVEDVTPLNQLIRSGKATQMIQVAEAQQEKQIAAVAPHIAKLHRDEGVSLVLISGPSSSANLSAAAATAVSHQLKSR